MKNIYKDVLLGVSVGDALGVPVEFISREARKEIPITDMVGYGTHNMPAGTWSDDSSMAFCLAEALVAEDKVDLDAIAKRFIWWLYQSHWTPYGVTFDYGGTTQSAIDRLAAGVPPELSGDTEKHTNGNGSLMRILPLIFETIKKDDIYERYMLAKEVSSMTHAHLYSVIACFYYLEFAKQIIEGVDKFRIYEDLKVYLPKFLESIGITDELDVFHRLLKGNIDELPENVICSTGYVIHTLEASIWCLLTTTNYKDAVLKAVNLGEDTDTTGAVTGGLAALLYGYETIPTEWVSKLARCNDIRKLADELKNKYTV